MSNIIFKRFVQPRLQKKVIGNFDDSKLRDNFKTNYIRWRFSKAKHNYYVKNRRSNNIVLDNYDKYIVENLKPGKTFTYDSAGYYLDPVVDNLTVIELVPIVSIWYPRVVIETDRGSVDHLYNQADNFIIINTVRLRWKTFNEYTEYWKYQSRFFKPGAHIFFSFRDIFIFHNRLKYKFSDLLGSWLNSMEDNGFKLINLSHTLINTTDQMQDYTHLQEIDDLINGNVKIHWEYQP